MRQGNWRGVMGVATVSRMTYDELKEALKNKAGRVVVGRARSQAISNDARTAFEIARREQADRAAGGGYSALLFTPEYSRKMRESGRADHAAVEMLITKSQLDELIALGAELDGNSD